MLTAANMLQRHVQNSALSAGNCVERVLGGSVQTVSDPRRRPKKVSSLCLGRLAGRRTDEGF